MLTVDGIPAHPLVVHAVLVLLPLAAVGTLLVVARPAWRRQLGVWVLLLAVTGVAAVPVATQTGEQLQQALGGGGPLVEIHEERAETLLLPALGFLVLLAATVLLGRRADAAAAGPGAAHALSSRAEPLRRVTLVVGVLAALAGLAVIGLVVWIGHSGSVAVWSGVVG
jgi:ABC-type Fe3+-siderophore transport system permease subunit